MQDTTSFGQRNASANRSLNSLTHKFLLKFNPSFQTNEIKRQVIGYKHGLGCETVAFGRHTDDVALAGDDIRE